MESNNSILVEKLQESIKNLKGIKVSDVVLCDFLDEYVDDVESDDVISPESLLNEFFDYADEKEISF